MRFVLSSQKLFNCQYPMTDRRLWTNQEDQIILNLVEAHGLKKWTTIADQMKKYFPQLARSSKQIRQRWYNHLDPDINKQPWTPEEDHILFQAHKKYGNKWKQIARLLQSRTDNSAKNHFYSTLRRSLRRINKFLGFKNSTNQMKILKPSILSKLIESADHSQESRALVNGIFHFANIKPSKSGRKSSTNIDQQEKEFFRLGISKIISFNEKYGENREILKKGKKVKPFSLLKAIEAESPQKTKVKKNKTPQQILTSSNNKLGEEYEMSIPSKDSWEDSSQKNYGMLPQLQMPEQQQVQEMGDDQNPPQFYMFELGEGIFQQIELDLSKHH